MRLFIGGHPLRSNCATMGMQGKTGHATRTRKLGGLSECRSKVKKARTPPFHPRTSSYFFCTSSTATCAVRKVCLRDIPAAWVVAIPFCTWASKFSNDSLASWPLSHQSPSFCTYPSCNSASASRYFTREHGCTRSGLPHHQQHDRSEGNPKNIRTDRMQWNSGKSGTKQYNRHVELQRHHRYRQDRRHQTLAVDRHAHRLCGHE